MASTTYTSPFEEHIFEPRYVFVWMLIIVFAFLGFAALTTGLLADGFATDSGARLQALVSLAGDEGSIDPRELALIYPLIPFLLSLAVAKIPFFADAAPYYVDCLAAALLLGLGYRRLILAEVSHILAVLMILAIALNPLFLFVATSGSGIAIALLFTYMFALGAFSLAGAASFRGLALIGLAYAGMLMTTPLGFYFLLASVPFLFFYARGRTEVPGAMVVLLVAVPIVVLGALLAANWFLVGEVSGFLGSLTGGVVGPRSEMSLEPWPFMMGDSPFGVVVVMAAGFFLAFPILALALTVVFAGGNMMRATLAMAGITVIAGAVTTYLGVLSHPVYLWVFAVPLALLALEELRNGIMGKTLAVVALTFGIGGGWWLLGLHPTLYLNMWRAEVSGGLFEANEPVLEQLGGALISRRDHWATADDDGDEFAALGGEANEQVQQSHILGDAFGVRHSCRPGARGGVDVAHRRCASRGDIHLLRSDGGF